MHRRLDANLLLSVVILADQDTSLRAMGEAFHRKMEENPLLHLVDEVIYDPLGVTEAAEHIVQIKCRDMPAIPRIKPNDYAGDSWRRQGKRRGGRR